MQRAGKSRFFTKKKVREKSESILTTVKSIQKPLSANLYGEVQYAENTNMAKPTKLQFQSRPE